MLKTRVWVALLTAAALVFGLWSVLLLSGKRGSAVAEIVRDGEVIREIDLFRVTEAYSFAVEGPEGGTNTILVQPGRICVAEADCPDQICVRQGWLTDQATPVVCLPHRLMIRLRGAGELDGVSK